jgi:hypothetical protein
LDGRGRLVDSRDRYIEKPKKRRQIAASGAMIGTYRPEVIESKDSDIGTDGRRTPVRELIEVLDQRGRGRNLMLRKIPYLERV